MKNNPRLCTRKINLVIALVFVGFRVALLAVLVPGIVITVLADFAAHAHLLILVVVAGDLWKATARSFYNTEQMNVVYSIILTSAFSISALAICFAKSASSVAVTTFGAICILNDPPASLMFFSMASHASFNNRRPS